jgi:hypothetical protein
MVLATYYYLAIMRKTQNEKSDRLHWLVTYSTKKLWVKDIFQVQRNKSALYFQYSILTHGHFIE